MRGDTGRERVWQAGRSSSSSSFSSSSSSIVLAYGDEDEDEEEEEEEEDKTSCAKTVCSDPPFTLPFPPFT
jgi:hypothetical protein